MDSRELEFTVKTLNDLMKSIKRYEALEIIDSVLTKDMINKIGVAKSKIYNAYRISKKSVS